MFVSKSCVRHEGQDCPVQWCNKLLTPHAKPSNSHSICIRGRYMYINIALPVWNTILLCGTVTDLLVRLVTNCMLKLSCVHLCHLFLLACQSAGVLLFLQITRRLQHFFHFRRVICNKRCGLFAQEPFLFSGHRFCWWVVFRTADDSCWWVVFRTADDSCWWTCRWV